ncbi:YciI family protein [Shewanella sedimentimangrovi]|uniref:DGPFAETKE family protein n=1 Tax=Shewanella sedimentimangrovi TaxID=2814293 RepID=A0ABX7QXM5_9GAMM|nr:YciI family protein [Shewanella sedimentimangrovi]QSX36272.1 hypothetical protein JYB85_13210 [Shewanella sedimentimangrovi]
MRFMVIRKADAATEQGVMPSEQLLGEMIRFNECLVNAGVFVSGEGLRPSADGARIRFQNGRPTVVEGPFDGTETLVAGYTIIQVRDKQEALEWMQQWPKSDGNGNVELELRRMFELEDFAPGEAIEQERTLCERLQRQPSSSCSYLNFNGNCREAFELYERLLGGKIEKMIGFADMPPDMGGEGCGAMADGVMHACLSFGGGTLMGSDAPADRYQPPQGFYVQLHIDSLPRAKELFNALAEGGTVHMPFGETFWAEGFGMLVDAFGIPWMINSNHKA